MMRRYVEALLLVLGLSWGLVPLAHPVSAGAGWQGLGAERAFFEAPGFKPFLGAATPLAPPAARARAWRAPLVALAVAPPPQESPRRRFLRLMRLQLDGG
ncbi:hypothetical protein [Oceanithermus sp.]